VLREAIITRRNVRLHYVYRGSGKRGYQVVHPYGFLYGNRHYLVAWSEINPPGAFEISPSPTSSGSSCSTSHSHGMGAFSLRDHAERSCVFQEEPVDVVWKFTPKAAADAREFLFHPAQITKLQPDGSLIVRFRAGGMLEMAWHRFTRGNEVDIVKPIKLRKMLATCKRA
jgi:predicted DNA-binding transcriptional regulator YafY